MNARRCVRYAGIFLLLAAFCPGTFCPGTFCPGTCCPALADSARADWPTYRADGHRSGISPEQLAMPLSARWVHRAAQPQPAWPEMPARLDVYREVNLGPTVTFDRAPHVVVGGDRLYFGSSADDTVYCLDVASGRIAWSFITGGPVRLAPTLAGGRVFAASDDGCLYCLDAATGELAWKYRAGPEDRRLPGNGRMMSLWPVRCGVAVDEGVVYACAGLFPSQGAYLFALEAQSGRPKWRREVDISAQGYMVASADRLFIPTGRTPPHIYRREDGEQIAPFSGTGQQRSNSPEGGGCFAVLAGEELLHQAGEKGGIQVTRAASREKIVQTSGLRVVVQGPTAYVLHPDRLVAVDRKLHIEWTRLDQKKKKTPADKKRIAELDGGKTPWLEWDVPCSAPYAMILAGDTILAGGDGQVVAHHADDGRALWSGQVSGKAYALAVSGGQLFVGTDTGRIHCFGHGASGAKGVLAETGRTGNPPRAQTPLFQQAAQEAIEAAGVNRGYCLVLGASDIRLAREISQRSKFRVICVEPDAAKVALARRKLQEAGDYGPVVVHQAPLDKLPYQKRFANLIVSADCLDSGTLPPSAAELARVLRPSGGTIVLAAPPNLADGRPLQAWGAASFPGWRAKQDSEGHWSGIARRGTLEGAGEWTHFYADPGNTACSGDTLAPGPVDIQWFGRPGPRRMVDRHEKNVAPLYKAGRLFISGDNYVLGVDAYNGTILWERDLPESIRLGAFKNCGSMAATDDRLYVAAGGRCASIDVATGHPDMFPMPANVAPEKSQWGYVAAVGKILFGSVTKPGATFRVQDIPTQVLIWRDRKPVVCSDALFALDRSSGNPIWTYTPEHGVLVNPAIAIGGGRVYALESTNPETRNVADGRIPLDLLFAKGANLVAIEATTGKLLWRRPVALEALQHIAFLSYAKETLLITGTKNVPKGKTFQVRYDLAAFRATTGKPLWKNTQTPVPDHILEGPHGEQVQHSAIVGETIYNTGFAVDLRTGEPADVWKWQKSDKCGALTTSAHCAFSRFSNPLMFALGSGEPNPMSRVTRPGCWVNIVPAGGLVLIPEASSGCTCYYSIQTSLALTPRDQQP